MQKNLQHHRCSRKAFTLLADEFKKQIKALGAKRDANLSADSTPVESNNEVVTLVVPIHPSQGNTASKRSSTSPKRRKGKKKVKTIAEKQDDIVEIRNSFQAITPEEFSDIEVDDCEDIVEDPPGVTADHTPTVSVAVPASQDNNDNQPATSSFNVDQAQPKSKRVPPIVIDEQYNTPRLLVKLSELIGTKLMGKIVWGREFAKCKSSVIYLIEIQRPPLRMIVPEMKRTRPTSKQVAASIRRQKAGEKEQSGWVWYVFVYLYN
ncbi:hypothetical protein TNCT_392231 [Trichonephila clavata]|uniref:Uncharacterized protein n=1 Tax=Trichonephila clavata TaxID=2740835 RepID=A0A8X6KKS1_TRICU|nr:hypothetical protein TNCT_392231 [Trichonephila clavata]